MLLSILRCTGQTQTKNPPSSKCQQSTSLQTLPWREVPRVTVPTRPWQVHPPGSQAESTLALSTAGPIQRCLMQPNTLRTQVSTLPESSEAPLSAPSPGQVSLRQSPSGGPQGWEERGGVVPPRVPHKLPAPLVLKAKAPWVRPGPFWPGLPLQAPPFCLWTSSQISVDARSLPYVCTARVWLCQKCLKQSPIFVTCSQCLLPSIYRRLCEGMRLQPPSGLQSQGSSSQAQGHDTPGPLAGPPYTDAAGPCRGRHTAPPPVCRGKAGADAYPILQKDLRRCREAEKLPESQGEVKGSNPGLHAPSLA